MNPLLEVKGLTCGFRTEAGTLVAVENLSFAIDRGETLCLVGESGSGKSVTALSIMRMLEFGQGRILGGEIWFAGQDLAQASQTQMQKIRGNEIGMIFQEPLTALNPVFPVGRQIAEAVQQHRGSSAQAALARALEMLRRVGIAPARANQYPHEFSGGMRQRVMIAMALACNPKLLIADEPTTALDVTTQAQILRLLRQLQAEFGMSLLLVTHDMGVAAELADKIAVMYGGKLVEIGTAEQLFEEPHHPYTAGLLASIPPMAGERSHRLVNLEGRFTPRCPYLLTASAKVIDPPLTDLGAGHLVATWYNYGPVAPAEPVQRALPASPGEGRPLIEVHDLTKHFARRRRLFSRANGETAAVTGVSFSIYPGETLGLVGESGSGKTTLGRMMLQLLPPSSGSVLFEGRDLTKLSPTELRPLRKEIQIIFQDPYGSLNPRMTVGQIIGEPLEIHGLARGRERASRVAELMAQVGLNPAWHDRYPAAFSGGQRQRISIARALSSQPKLIVADEAVSALDVSVQAQIINLLMDLQEQLGLAYLFIAHGLAVVRHISHRVAVMYKGRLVELAETDELFRNPLHAYTKQLLAAVPVPDPKARRRSEVMPPTQELAQPGAGLQEVRPNHWVAD